MAKQVRVDGHGTKGPRTLVWLAIGLATGLALTALTACTQEDACLASCRSQYDDCIGEGSNPIICDDFLADCENMCFSAPPP